MKFTRLGMDPYDVMFGANLREIRTRRGISLAALGDEIGVSYQQVLKYETGRNRASISTLVRIAQFLKIDVYSLLAGIDGIKGLDKPEQTEIECKLKRIRMQVPRAAQQLAHLIEALDDLQRNFEGTWQTKLEKTPPPSAL